jgi:phage shock protein PspC (stress-responsive transcriptional regulator)
MEKIIQINYQNRSFPFEEAAYRQFQDYEQSLADYFLSQDCGEEIMTDLKNRMAEIFDEKIKQGSAAINQSDIDTLIHSIGRPSDFDSEEAGSETRTSGQAQSQTGTTSSTADSFERKRLYRNQSSSSRIIAGVCSGIAHYFAIDPIAVRIVFVLAVIFNLISFMHFNLAILAYIVLWIVLPKAFLKPNAEQKLFRNSKDKVIAGVCSGLAQFFNTESWIIRTVFLLPLLISITSHGSFFKFHFLGSSLGSFLFVIYIVLWIITPLAKSATDFMLLKGEPINLSTIQKPMALQHINTSAKSGINSFFKILAYILLTIGLIIFVPTCISFLLASFFTFNIVNIILFTPLLKTLGWLCILLVFALPLLAIVVWIIRRIAGVKKSSPALRIAFSSLWFVGLICGFVVIINLIMNMKSFDGKKTTTYITSPQDTLFVKPLDSTSTSKYNGLFNFNSLGDVIQINSTDIEVKSVKLRYKQASDTMPKMVIERFSFGSNLEDVNRNIDRIEFNPIVEDNIIYLPAQIKVPTNAAYRCQHVRVTIYIPDSKTLIISEDLKKQMKYRLNANKKGFYISSNNMDEDIEVKGRKSHTVTVTVEDEGEMDNDTIRIPDLLRKDSVQEAVSKREEMEEQLREAEEQVREAQRKLEDEQREAQQQLEDAQRELDRIRREGQ